VDKKNQRRIILINPSFQIRLGIYLVLILIIASIVYPLTIYELVNTMVLEIKNQLPLVVERLNQKKPALIWLLVFWHIGISGVVFISCLFVTHRIAGPIYKLQMYLNNIQDIEKADKLTLRKGDYFQEMSETVNSFLGRIRERSQSDMVYLDQVKAYINSLASSVPEDKRIILQEINKKLTDMQKR
jgi:hypothetical protein